MSGGGSSSAAADVGESDDLGFVAERGDRFEIDCGVFSASAQPGTTRRHEGNPQRSKRVANAAFGPSGEVDDGPTASPLHRRGLIAAELVSAMGPPAPRSLDLDRF